MRTRLRLIRIQTKQLDRLKMSIAIALDTGSTLKMQNEQGEAKSFFVTEIRDGMLTVDGNHPLAGKHLNVHVTILEVRNALPGEERTSGVHAEPMTKH